MNVNDFGDQLGEQVVTQLLMPSDDPVTAIRQWHALHLILAYDGEDARAVVAYAERADAGPDSAISQWAPVLRYPVVMAMLFATNMNPAGQPAAALSAGDSAAIAAEAKRLLGILAPREVEHEAAEVADYLAGHLPAVPVLEVPRWDRGRRSPATLHAAAAVAAAVGRIPRVAQRLGSPPRIWLLGGPIALIDADHGPLEPPMPSLADDIGKAVPPDARRLDENDVRQLDVCAAELLLGFVDDDPAAVSAAMAHIGPYGERGYRVAYSQVSTWGVHWQDKALASRRIGSATWVPILRTKIDTLVPEPKRLDVWRTYLPTLMAVTQSGGSGVPRPTAAVEEDLYILAAYAAVFGALVPDPRDVELLRVSLDYLRRPDRPVATGDLPAERVSAAYGELATRFGQDFAAGLSRVPADGQLVDELVAAAATVAGETANDGILAWMTHLRDVLVAEAEMTAQDRAKAPAPRRTPPSSARTAPPGPRTKGTGDPSLDGLLATMPMGYREMMGRMQAWTTRLVLAYADKKPETVRSVLAQIDGWRRPIWDGAPEPMPQWRSAHRQASATFDILLEVSAQHPSTTATIRQIGHGAAQQIRICGPTAQIDLLVAATEQVASGEEITAFADLSDEKADEAATILWSAASSWLFNKAFPSREMGRLALTTKIREGEQIALGAPSPEWDATIADSTARDLLGSVLGLAPALLPPLDPAERNLLEHDLVAVAKLFLMENPAPCDEDLHALRSQLRTMITAFEIPHQTQRPPARPKAKPRPKRPGKKNHRR